jgi:Asp-tRNA(Asn)/Glu-tRNA(Gln) amidotransferase A subunit family amidase
MKKSVKLILLVSIVISSFVLGNLTGSIGKKSVIHSQKLLGFTFKKDQIETMLPYLNRNLEGYEQMRNFNLGDSIVPALFFDPVPKDFNIEENENPNDWPINEDIQIPDDLNKLAFFSISDLAGLIKTKQITSLDLTNFFLNRIEKYDDKLQSFITVTKDLAIRQAQKADEELVEGLYRGPLHGIPYGIKDLAAVPSYPTTWGAFPYKDQVIDQKATVVQKLEDAGAVLLGKLVSGSLARGDVWFGGKTKNPWDLEQGATGSSAGSGSATAAGLVPFSIGTETLGSVISPSTRTGSTGLRPTFGAVSRNGFMVLSWSMDKVGPICRSAADCAIVYDYIRGADLKDPISKDSKFNSGDFIEPSRLRIAYFKDLFEQDSSEVGSNNSRFLEELKEMGIESIPIDLPSNFPFKAFDIILRAESGAFFDELIRSGGVDQLVEQHEGSRANSLRQSRFIPAVEYIQANRHRTLLIQKVHALFKEFDLILSPTYGMNQLLITNLTGHPALSLPNGFDNKERPTSVTLLANYFGEEKLISFATAYQTQFKYHGLEPTPLR